MSEHEAGVEVAPLPCPFCGGVAVVETINLPSGRPLRYSVGCNDEQCIGYQAMTTYARKAEAIAAWNRRASLPAPQGPAAQVSEAVMVGVATGSELVTLADCPVGLFMAGDELCLKTEYGNNEGRIDAYIVSSGEFFWGSPPQTIASQRAQLVRPAAPQSPSPDTGARAKLVEHMVNRFLSWKLPEHFHPDAGISFAPEYNVEFNAKRGLPPARHMPTGTNLFDATQAREMVAYMLDGFPLDTGAQGAEPVQPAAWACVKCNSPRSVDPCPKCGTPLTKPADGWEWPTLPDIDRIRALAREVGYAVGVHGSLERDLDLIAAPWAETAVSPLELAEHIAAGLSGRVVDFERQDKPCGRWSCNIHTPDWTKMIDLSVMPPALTQPQASREAIKVSVKTMKLSDGSEDYYVAITVGDREITPHKYRIRGRAEFDVANWNWLLNGGEKPSMRDWLDRTRDPAEQHP